MTEEQQKIADAFKIEKRSAGYACQNYVVKRLNNDTAWPSHDDLLKICDDGWESFFQSPTNVRHFGGVVGIKDNEAFVKVYID